MSRNRQTLLDPEFLRKLERISTRSKRTNTRPLLGNNRSPGSALRPLEDTDNGADKLSRFPHQNDLEAPAQIKNLFNRLFAEEDDISIHMLVDAAESMEFGQDTTKFEWARKFAAASGCIGLIRYDHVGLNSISQASGRRSPELHGRAAIPGMLEYLQGIQPGGRTHFAQSIRKWVSRMEPRGILVVLSDFLDPRWDRGLNALQSCRCDVVLLQILDPHELEPNILKHLCLVDTESGNVRDLTAIPQVLERCRALVDEFRGAMEFMAERNGWGYVCASTDTPMEDLLLKSLRGLGLLQE